METVIVIGGGASGMMAALTAAEDRSRRVIILERQQRLGRKLLCTGNGRCNLTNTGAGPANYHGERPDFPLPALEGFSSADALRFFAGLGLVTVTEYGGRVYPLSNSANSVLDVLRFALEASGVAVRGGCPVRELRRDGGGFSVVTDSETLFADKVIVACGGAAGAKLGGVTDGYELLRPLGHKRTALYPALSPLLTDSDYPRALKGVRADGSLALLSGGEVLAQSRGEIQFTETGVSGPAAFDISRAASVAGAGLRISADFFADYDASALIAMLRARRESLPRLESGELFTGMLHNRLGRMMIKYAGLDSAAPLEALDGAALEKAASAAKGFALPLRGVEGFDAAQVTAGGVRTGGFNSETLESYMWPGLFACGELLDVDGDCGGYNLQWAWASGRLAGRLGK